MTSFASSLHLRFADQIPPQETRLRPWLRRRFGAGGEIDDIAREALLTIGMPQSTAFRRQRRDAEGRR